MKYPLGKNITPAKQTVLHEEGTKGNCLRASLASLFQINIDSIPAFELMQKNAWRNNLLQWLKDQGLTLLTFDGDVNLNTYYLGIGPSHRGVKHCCIFKDGEIQHDPHPSNSGLLHITESWVFQKDTIR
jgi:hypothetical protein